MQTHNLCQKCGSKHRQPPYIQVLPEYTCTYCDKNQSEILYLGQPSCLKCLNKLSVAVSTQTFRQSEHGCQRLSGMSGINTSLITINRKITKQGSEHKIMKKVNDLLNGFTFTKTFISKLKNLVFYWSRQAGKNLVWSQFIERVQKQSPLVFMIQAKGKMVGVFMNQNIQKKKGAVQDKYVGCFQITGNNIQFSQLQKNRFVVRHEKHIICYGSPGSVHIIFDTMDIEAEYFKDSLQHPIDQFVAVKL